MFTCSVVKRVAVWVTQRNRGPEAELEARIHGFSERGAEAVEVD